MATSHPIIEIAPSILACNLAFLADEVRKAEAGGAAAIHVDVMDGHFVPNLTPVSYTHLDVYKRQHWRSAARRRSLCRRCGG